DQYTHLRELLSDLLASYRCAIKAVQAPEGIAVSVVIAALRRYADRVISPAQVRAARALLKMTQSELAAVAKVGLQTLKNYELEASDPRGSTLRALEQALRAAGVIFLDADAEGGPGVRLAR